MDIRVKIEGIHCAGCLNRIQQSLTMLGVNRFDMDLITHVAEITYDEESINQSSILSAIEMHGYRVIPMQHE